MQNCSAEVKMIRQRHSIPGCHNVSTVLQHVTLHSRSEPYGTADFLDKDISAKLQARILCSKESWQVLTASHLPGHTC